MHTTKGRELLMGKWKNKKTGEVVEAVQWRPTHSGACAHKEKVASPDADSEKACGCGAVIEGARIVPGEEGQPPQALKIVTRHENRLAADGDFVVRREDGSLDTVSSRTMAIKYSKTGAGAVLDGHE